MDFINIKELTGIFPHYFYQRIQVDGKEVFFAEKIPMSYGYIIRRLWIKYPSVSYPLEGYEDVAISIAPALKLEFLEIGSGKARQPSPLPVELISSPVNNGFSYQAVCPFPVDDKGFNLNNSAAGSVRYSPILNYLLMYGDQVWIKFSGQEYRTAAGGMDVPAFWSPGFIDLVVEGYMVPDNKFAVTKGGNP
jgi:hypothetical protein